jgi:GntR family transcriptional regulator
VGKYDSVGTGNGQGVDEITSGGSPSRARARAAAVAPVDVAETSGGLAETSGGVVPRAGEAEAGGRPSLVDGAEGALRNWLAAGRYRQGDRLAPEHEVAAMLGVSRGTLRSALQRLEESGEIVRRQGSGTFVGRMAVPTAFGERLERLEPYSSVASRRGLVLTAIDIKVEQRPVGSEVGEALALDPAAEATTVARTLVADGSPVAIMFDVVHPGIDLPDEGRLRAALERGQMVLDVLIEIGVPVTYARTRVMPALLTARERAGKALGIRRITAGLELEELIFAGRDDRVAYSRDLFAPGGTEVMVMRSLDSPRPARIAGRRGTDRGAGRPPGAPVNGGRSARSSRPSPPPSH